MRRLLISPSTHTAGNWSSSCALMRIASSPTVQTTRSLIPSLPPLPFGERAGVRGAQPAPEQCAGARRRYCPAPRCSRIAARDNPALRGRRFARCQTEPAPRAARRRAPRSPSALGSRNPRRTRRWAPGGRTLRLASADGGAVPTRGVPRQSGDAGGRGRSRGGIRKLSRSVSNPSPCPLPGGERGRRRSPPARPSPSRPSPSDPSPSDPSPSDPSPSDPSPSDPSPSDPSPSDPSPSDPSPSDPSPSDPSPSDPSPYPLPGGERGNLAGGGAVGVAHEHRDGHGADAARDRGDGASLGGHRVEVHVAGDLAGGQAVDADVDDHHALADHVAGDDARLPRRHAQDVGAPAVPGQVARARVAHGHGGVAREEQLG